MRLIALTFLLTVAAFGQQFNVKYIKTSSDKFPTLISSLQVYDASENPVEGLSKNNFVSSVDGKESQLLDAVTYEKSGIGCYIVLCVDLSGSMKGKPLQTLKNSIRGFIDDLRDIDKLSIVGFSDNYELICDFSNDKNYLKKEVDQMQTSGSRTALFYGVYKGIEHIRKIKDAGQVAIVISDGKDEPATKSYSDDDIISAARADGIPIFTIGYTNGDRSYFQILEKIANQTGGSFYNSPGDDDLQQHYKKLYKQILNIYLVTHNTEEKKADGLEHIIAVTVSYAGSSKTASSKFTAPAGVIVKRDSTGGTLIDGGNGFWDEYLSYVIEGGVVFLGLIGGFFVYRKKKQRKTEEQQRLDSERRQKEEEEKRRIQQIEAQNAAKSVQPQQNQDEQLPQRSGAKTSISEQKTVIARQESDRTVIMREGSTSSATNLVLDFAVGAYAGHSFQISSGGATIGRAADNTIQLSDGTVSGHHAKITYNNGKFFVEDLGSSNGTFINGNQITISELINGSVFKFGSCEGYVKIF